MAATLSAGLDSSSVAGVAAAELRRVNRRLEAYHAAPALGHAGVARDGWIADESEDVLAIALMHDNMDLTVLRGPWRSPLDDAVPLFEVLFAPVRNATNLSWYFAIYAAARDAGAGVLLTGGKGNYTISPSGAPWLHELFRRGHLFAAVREVSALARATGRKPVDLVKYTLLRPILPPVLIRVRDRLRGLPPAAPIWEETLSAIRPEFATAMRLEERKAALALDDVSVSRWRWNQHRVFGLTATGDSFDVGHSLRARFGIETREPTTDVRLVEFCLNLPGSAFLERGVDRLLVRRSMRDVLPPAVLDRTTRGAQAADWTQWLSDARGDVIAELDALNRIEAARECLDLPRLHRLVQDWPEQLRLEHLDEYGIRLMRGLMMGRFIRWFEEVWT